jgi:hypothetical protein
VDIPCFWFSVCFGEFVAIHMASAAATGAPVFVDAHRPPISRKDDSQSKYRSGGYGQFCDVEFVESHPFEYFVVPLATHYEVRRKPTQTSLSGAPSPLSPGGEEAPTHRHTATVGGVMLCEEDPPHEPRWLQWADWAVAACLVVVACVCVWGLFPL